MTICFRGAALLSLTLALSVPASAQVSQQIGVADSALLFGGSDAEGGIGDWYVSNGVVQAIIDQAGPQTDLTPLLPGNEPPVQSEIAETGGSLIDLGRVGQNDDQLAQMLTVGGLSTANFIRYSSVSAPTPGTVRAVGKLLFPPISPRSAPCIDVVTDYSAFGSDPFLTVTTTATNNCGGPAAGFGGFLDVFVWTQRGLAPFSGGGTPAGLGGKGFVHPVLNLASPASALELPTFMAAPGQLRPSDGLVDTANLTTSGEVAYGLLGVSAASDPDGGGPMPPTTTTAVNGLFGVSSTLISALGNVPLPGNPPVGGTVSYTRRIYVGATNDVRSVSDGMITALAGRGLFNTGSVFGNIDAADSPNVEATLVVTRVGTCTGAPTTPCKLNADCTGVGTCADSVVIPGQGVGAAMTQIRTDANGAFSGVVLPAGDYEFAVQSAERNDVVVPRVSVPAFANRPVAVPLLSARGTVNFTVKEKKGGVPLIPAKLTFKGTGTTPDPRFHRDYTVVLGTSDVQVETFGGTQAGSSGSAAGQGNVVYTTGQGSIELRPGTYDVYASRGNEYTVQKTPVTVSAGSTASIAFQLKRVLKTKNALSADFHIHSARSLDSSAALRDRALAFSAEGIEVMVATDHDKNVDYAPILSGLGLTAYTTSIVGDEVTGSVPNAPAWPNSIGHINAWPMSLQKDQPRDGAPQDEWVAPNFVFSRLRNQGAQVIQYNHPRAGLSGITSIGIFNNIGCNRCANAIDTPCTVNADCPAAPAPQSCTCVGYQPDRPIDMAPNDILLDSGVLGPGSPANPDGFDNLSFDVMEILNGNKDTDYPGIRQIRRDWLSLLNQGIYRPGTGVSDSHRITVEHAGWARTYVNGVGDVPPSLDTTAFDNDIRAGNILISGGPWIEFSARPTNKATTAGMGGTVSVTNGLVKLKIRVFTPAWMPVEEVRLIANGFQVAAFDSTTSPKVKAVPANFQSPIGTRRFVANLTRQVTQDTYFIVEAGPKLDPNPNVLPVSPPIVDIVEPDIVPIAITNPIFVDTDGNSTFDPPGLPVMAAAATPATFDEAPGFLAGVRELLHGVASRLRGEVVAGNLPGEMTGITEEQKQKAVAAGEYIPLHEFSLPADAVSEVLRKANEAEQQRLREAEPKK